jgi:P-type E1-E2 ATPase
VSRLYEIPGRSQLVLERVLMDVNGTLTGRGELLPGVAPRMAKLGETLSAVLLSADTFGTAGAIAVELGVELEVVSSGADKVRVLNSGVAERTAAIGNGTNDAGMLQGAALGIAVLGPEGLSGAALAAAEVVCGSILDALDLLLEPRLLAATLRP